MAINITKASVRRALEQWFIAARAGKTMGARETAELSAHDAAAASSDYFFELLCQDEDTVPHRTGDSVAQFEFDMTQAEQLLGMFGGDTGMRISLGRNAQDQMVAWGTDLPEEGSVVLESFEDRERAEFLPPGVEIGELGGHPHDDNEADLVKKTADEFFG